MKATGPGFASRFFDLAGGYWNSEKKWQVRILTVGLVVLTLGQVVVPVMINLWSQQLFDALEQRSWDRFTTMVGLAFGIILFNVINTVLHLRVKRRLQFGWRRWLSERVLDMWLVRGRHHQVTYLPGEHDNPDGRIHEDIRITTEYAIDLAHSLFYCVTLLVSFINILWMLSGTLHLEFWGMSFSIDGYLLYIALVYALAGTTIAILVGQPLVTAVNKRQGLEADFRVGLVRVREHAQAIALQHGEMGERVRLRELILGVRAGWYMQTHRLSNVMAFQAVYGVVSVAFPILVAAPRYIAGTITLGVLMQTTQAFQQTAAALSWPIDNLARLAEWKASVERVFGLYDALRVLERETEAESDQRISVERLDSQISLSFQNLTLCEPDGTCNVAPFDAEIQPGERVLISGDPAAAMRLFRAVARVWPWGHGRVLLPAHTRVFFMPQRPYLPHGPLRQVLSYPAPAETVSDDLAQRALRRVGLNHLLPQLDQTETWTEVLVVADQQRLGFARLLVRRPDWIFVENATDSLEPVAEEAMLRLLDEEFPMATLLTIGNHAVLDAHHTRRLVFDRTKGTVSFREEIIIPEDGIGPASGTSGAAVGSPS